MMWLALLPAWAAFNTLAYLLAPLLPLFAVERMGACDNNHAMRTEPRLPVWLGWFDMPDNSLLGDFDFHVHHIEETYWQKVLWLWRNPACGFEAGVLSAAIAPSDTPEVDGDPQVQDGPAGREGWCFVLLGGYWNLVAVRRFGSTRCLKLDLGWQLKTYAEDPARIATQPAARYAMSIRFPRFVDQQQ